MSTHQFIAAQSHHQKGELKKALNIYASIKDEQRTDYIKIYHALCLIQMGKNTEAHTIFYHSNFDKIQLLPEFLTGSLVAKYLGDYKLSISLLNMAKQRFPENTTVLINSAVLSIALGDNEAASKDLLTAEKLGLNSVELRLNQAQICIRNDDLVEAEKYIQMASVLNKNHYDVFYLNGLIAEQRHQFDLAYGLYTEALSRNLTHSNCWSRLAALFNEGAWFQDSIDYKKLLKLFNSLKQLGAVDISIISHVVSIQRKSMTWYEIDYFEKVLSTSIDNNKIPSNLQPFVCLNLPLRQENITKLFRAQNSKFDRSGEVRLKSSLGNLKVGLISSDLRNHAIGTLLKDIVSESEDIKKFNVYYTGPSDNSNRLNIYKSQFANFKEFRGIGFDDQIDIIKSDGTNVLIDLNGITSGVSINVLKNIDIPVVHWLGLPSSNGTNVYDYIILDENVLPQAERGSVMEKVIYMPRCYVPSRKLNIYNKRNQNFLFASYQNYFKYNPTLLNTWKIILDECKTSRLIIGVPDIYKAKFEDIFKDFSFDMDRVQFDVLLPFEKHIDRLRNIDCILDTFPYNGGTSVADALEVGVPVITLAGQSIVSRVASSILSSSNLNDLICSDLEEYINKAISLYRKDKNILENSISFHKSYFGQPSLFAKDLISTLLKNFN